MYLLYSRKWYKTQNLYVSNSWIKKTYETQPNVLILCALLLSEFVITSTTDWQSKYNLHFSSFIYGCDYLMINHLYTLINKFSNILRTGSKI